MAKNLIFAFQFLSKQNINFITQFYSMMRANMKIGKSSANSRYQSQKEILPNVAESFHGLSSKLEKFADLQEKNISILEVQYLKSLMEERDQCILIKTPILSKNNEQRQKQIKIWLGDVSKYVFSSSFNYFSNKILKSKRMKAFCSQSFIGNIINLSKENKLTRDDFQFINRHLKKQILPYYLLRYPQSDSKEVNLSLANKVEAMNSLNTNENNLIMKSKIDFRYKEDGDYSQNILKFINYLISIPNIKVNENLTMSQSFNKQMEDLFTSIYKSQWTESTIYEEYEETQNEEKLLEDYQALNAYLQKKKKKKHHQRKQEEEVEKKYEEQVKSYTEYLIGQKVSKNIPTISEEQIQYKKIDLKYSSLLRIVIKWCEELEQKFEDPYYFLELDEAFLLVNGKEAQMATHIRKNLCEYAQSQWKKIQEFHSEIYQSSYKAQSDLSFRNLLKSSSHNVPQFQANVIKFSQRINANVYNYAFCYLNRLIHGLMKISNQVYSDLIGWTEWPCEPQLLTFTISDLLRCKCHSKEKEIIRIYNELQIQSILKPEEIKIIRIKNRLNKGTRDILMNVLLHNEAICQIQLGIASHKSEFILYSDYFNHYVYELKRSIFGPISQMCSIWQSIDERADLLSDQKIYIDVKLHECLEEQKQYERQILPFVCSECSIYVSQSQFILENQKCMNCRQYWRCGNCRLRFIREEELREFLIEKTEKNLGQRIQHFNQIPEYAFFFNINSLVIIPFEVKLFNLEEEQVLVYMSNNKLNIMDTVKYGDHSKKFNFNEYIVFENTEPVQQLVNVTEQNVKNEISILEIKECYRKKYQAIRIPNKNLSEDVILKVEDPKAQKFIKTLSLPKNSIKELKNIAKAFPSIKILNLNANGLQSLQGLGSLKKITDLYLTQNIYKEIQGLGQLTELRYAELGWNSSAPVIKGDLSKLKKLQTFTLSLSKLPQFPLPVLDLCNLKTLWLYSNEIKVLPPEISKLKRLQELQLSFNQIEVIPHEISECQELKIFILNQNQVKEFPTSMSSMINLRKLNISLCPIKQLSQEFLKLKQIVYYVDSEQYAFLKDSVDSQRLKIDQ